MARVPLTVALMTYNRVDYLRESVQAVLAQTYTDFEFLILDNHSTDSTASVVFEYDDPRIRYVRNAPGFTALFNGISALKIARGKRLIITHDDDVMMPNMLKRQMDFMDSHPDMMAVWTNVSIVDEDGGVVQPYHIPKGNDRVYAVGGYLSSFPEEQLLPLPSTLMLERSSGASVDRSSFFTKIYLDNELASKQHKFHGGDDVLAPALMNTRGSVAFLNEPLLKYRRHAAQNTNDVHISKPVLNTHRLLHKLMHKHADKIPNSAASEPILGNYVLRYAAQHEIVNFQPATLSKRIHDKLAQLLTQGLENIGKNRQASHPLLPLIICVAQQRGDVMAIAELPSPGPAQSRTVHALHRWAVMRRKGLNLFDSVPKRASIAILGSSMVAALLVIEARSRGLDVICLDSKPSRQGRKMLGVPIFPPEHLHSSKVGHVILSSEREQDDYLHQFIHSFNPRVKVLSWKELAVNRPSVTLVESESEHDKRLTCE